MGLIFRKRVRTGRNSWANISRSGVSVSRRAGPLTMNSRGQLRIRIGKGLSWRVK